LKDEFGGARSMHDRNDKYEKILAGKPEAEYIKSKLRIEVRCVLQKQDIRVIVGLFWLRDATSGNSFEFYSIFFNFYLPT
jgi:hypothetical protein